jgi:hypothetical protein
VRFFSLFLPLFQLRGVLTFPSHYSSVSSAWVASDALLLAVLVLSEWCARLPIRAPSPFLALILFSFPSPLPCLPSQTVIYHNRTQLSPDLEDGATYVPSLDALLSESDVVSLNLPLNAKTKHTIGAAQFKAMKKTAIVINTARGGVIDEQALVEALEAGEIAGCGLDVYEVEPNGVHPGLLKSDKAFLLPHVGYVFCLSFLLFPLPSPFPRHPFTSSRHPLLSSFYTDAASLSQNPYRRDSARDGGRLPSQPRKRNRNGQALVHRSGAEGALLEGLVSVCRDPYSAVIEVL